MVLLPKMNEPRHRHCSFVCKNHLFAIFGFRSLVKYSKTAEFINLKDPKAKFESFEIPNYDSFLISDAVIF